MNPEELKYTASLTGDPFLYFEMREVSTLLLEGLSPEEIKEKVYSENLFQYKTRNRIDKRLNEANKRLKLLDEPLLMLLVDGPSETGKVITLYTIYKTNRLFYDFMQEVVRDKLVVGQNSLEDMDFSLFFQRKADEDENVASWKESTVKKLKQVIKSILIETGILNKEQKVQSLIFHPDLKNYLLDKREKSFLDCIEGRI